jgi:(E)-4-hydroxy-3-methylbut-2-enyl-diphosphate synthase
MTYPFHLGVTEAGDGEDGRIKSAVGIGALLEDGIGDTIRVSLTEDSIYEIPVAQALVKKFNSISTRQYALASARQTSASIHHLIESWSQQVNPYEYRRRPSLRANVPGFGFGAKETVRVGLAFSERRLLSRKELANLVGRNGNGLAVIGQTPTSGERAERLESGNAIQLSHLASELRAIGEWTPLATPLRENGIRPEISLMDVTALGAGPAEEVVLNHISNSQRHGTAIEFLFYTKNFHHYDELRAVETILSAALKADYWNWSVGIALPPGGIAGVGAARALIAYLDGRGATLPITLRYSVPVDYPDWRTDASAQLGALLCDGVGDAVVIGGEIAPDEALRFGYNLLQATRLRISKTEFISCPSCGRTLFNLQTTTERIKAKTGHLKGVKIAIMGCIVNGPGEMADADFGYVGAGPQKVNLFVGKECVERNVPEEQADGRLVELIKKHNRWLEPAG